MEEFLKYERYASRLELLIIRPLYSCILGIVLWVYMIIAGICNWIQGIIVLITGERNESLNNYIKQAIEFFVQMLPYTSALTDKRPEFTHKEMRMEIDELEYNNYVNDYFKYERYASRLELLIIRPLYSCVLCIVLWVYMMIGGICSAIQWLIVLITGERNGSLNNYIKQYVEFFVQILPYSYMLTDKRPDLSHKQVNIFVELLW